MELTNASLRTPHSLARAACPALLVLSACASDVEPASGAVAGPAKLRAEAHASAATTTLNDVQMQALSDAEGTFFASVRAEGSGCPEGTLNTRVSDDGQAFTTTFSAFDLHIDPSSDAISRDCRFVVMLDAPGGRSFCVQQFGYSGNAFLQQGVSGRQVADYYFNEQKLATSSVRKDLVGPFDDDFVFTDTVQPDDEIWSPCDEQRDLYVDTKLELSNGDPRGAGLINVSAADGQNAMQFKLASHRCDMARNQGWTMGPFEQRRDKLVDAEQDPPSAPDDVASGASGSRAGSGTVGQRGTSSGSRGGPRVGSIGRTVR